LPLNSFNARKATYDYAKTRADAYRVGVAKVRQYLLETVSQSVFDAIHSSTNGVGIASLSLASILDFLEARYSKLTDNDNAIMYHELTSIKCQAIEDLPSCAAKARRLFESIARVGGNVRPRQPLAEREKMEHLTAMVLPCPALSAALMRYTELHPFSDRVFDTAVEYIESHAVESVTTAGTAGYAGAGMGYVNAATGHNLRNKRSRQDSPEPDAAQANRGGRGSGRGRGGRGKGRGTGRASGRGQIAPAPTNAAPLPIKYCFEHGYQRSHQGSACNIMQRDASYTQPMKDAQAPCIIDGYQGSTKENLA